MEQTTFQKRIEEKAKQRLLTDLYNASVKLDQVGSLIGHDFSKTLKVDAYTNYSYKTEYNLKYGQEIFDKLLPRYISNVTEEILKKVDEIDWLVSERNQENNSDY